MGYFAFPWEQIGTLLRRLSLAGGAGNAAAWVLFAAIGGCPLILWGLLARQRKSSRAELLLPVLSLTLFSGLWFLINPSYLEAGFFPAGMGEAGKGAFALAIDSVLLCWLLLRFLRSSGKMSRKSLLRSLELLLGLYVVLAGAAILLQAGAELGKGWENMGVSVSGGTDRIPLFPDTVIAKERSLGLSRCFLVLQTVCRYLPDCLELVLCTAAIFFLRSCEQGSFREESLKQMERLKKLSVCSLGAAAGANVCANLLQLAFAKYLYSSNYTLVFPVRQIIFMLGALMLSRFWLESKKLKDDNGLFI
ncbi:MAG: hypothetical protein NC517_13540 [Firmicutes bacterium]|nr:hypothetical protein [Bacillota bacterium]